MELFLKPNTYLRKTKHSNNLKQYKLWQTDQNYCLQQNC